ncbi:HAD family hydrolase [Paenibacillus oenotherae]|uniref:HAD family hydrolase n=1 Tax=Paenibacillus oenotherae TaxID=1435645 RepID=A0ABS7D5G0_9BACL|nr:HAD family hydrolase [Paenibacillus oenotherae]MBW7474711.1 HAD family hydrolase [Paenibacillus oenotherae]
MGKASRYAGIIFDMDNTLLRSSIDFLAMKTEIFHFLAGSKLIPETVSLSQHTSSTLIAAAAENGMSEAQLQQVWAIAAKHEVAGMEGAGLEQGAAQLLDHLKGSHELVVVTNNAHSAAVKALGSTGIIDRFSFIVGREQMGTLKPAPAGFHYVLERLPYIPSHQWISIGDSWIDGKAAAGAGIAFISYRTSIEQMAQRGVAPIGAVDQLQQVIDYLYSKPS